MSYKPIKFVPTKRLEELAELDWSEIPQYRDGFLHTNGERQEIATTIQRMAQRALGSKQEFRNSKMKFENNEWVMPSYGAE